MAINRVEWKRDKNLTTRYVRYCAYVSLIVLANLVLYTEL